MFGYHCVCVLFGVCECMNVKFSCCQKSMLYYNSSQLRDVKKMGGRETNIEIKTSSEIVGWIVLCLNHIQIWRMYVEMMQNLFSFKPHRMHITEMHLCIWTACIIISTWKPFFSPLILVFVFECCNPSIFRWAPNWELKIGNIWNWSCIIFTICIFDRILSN